MRKIKHVNVELTRNCNLSCDYCFNNSGKVGDEELGSSDWYNAIDIAKSYGAKSILLTGGEPMTRADTPLIVNYAVGRGLHTSILSNGYILNESNRNMIKSLASVQISLDSVNVNLHDAHRGKGSWDDAREAIDYVRSLNVPVEISSVISIDRIDELDGIARIAYETGSKVLVRPMQSLGGSIVERSQDLNMLISEKKNLLNDKFGDVFVDDSFGYVPVLGPQHDEIMIPKGIMTVLPNGDIRGTNENILQLAVA